MAYVDDGFSTIIAFSTPASVAFKEKSVTPPGVDGGGENDITTMRNTAWRTRAPKQLKTLTEASLTVTYDPEVYDDIVAAVNINQLFTITFPDSSTLAFWGWLNSFTPGDLVEGSQGEAEISIIPSNADTAGSEVAPVYAAAPAPSP